jgi:hypothetical protein
MGILIWISTPDAGVPLVVKFRWKDTDKAANPGKIGVLEVK